MRILALSVLLLLTGCGSMSPMQMMGNNMLDTAPKGDFDVIYPDWGNTPAPVAAGVHGPMGQTRTSSYDSLQRFLLDNGIDYEVMPGNHVMVKLKNTVKFDTGSSNVSQDSAYWLNVMGSFLSREHGIDVVIDGHTDNTGKPKFNDSLSVKRAQMVKNTLIQKNVSRDAIYTRGYGEYVPACTNRTTAGRACNRRVELLFIVSNN
ncbi:OmpA family protein [Vibrio fluvialis]|uniref:OmpA family protein n=1 Tax=Vibrio fluvialis TaxID=676 RepID=UPI001C9CEA49|nr:OmpA family protein [Vibrio fluvialis]EKO3905455.1 OmpA family protein [Vibrio fluvialis]EKO3959124.1 OmpA family protein [Vibrio fluvialis]EMC0406558.1 OmpA family protein [Vibrio fluvialis]MBY7997330.1 OmpA family protein [Vibrio fluvialis]MBY8104755.1 OmpA family protein [Vibrio fluvialis]